MRVPLSGRRCVSWLFVIEKGGELSIDVLSLSTCLNRGSRAGSPSALRGAGLGGGRETGVPCLGPPFPEGCRAGDG